MSHSHHHHHQQMKGRDLLIAIVLNVSITLAQVVGGIISGSLALLSDALHNFTDVISLIISYVANRLSRREASTRRTFGYKRAEIIAAFINAASLLVIAIYLVYEAVVRFIHPKPISAGLVIWLALLAIVANGVSVFLLQKGKEKNMNIHSAYLHMFSDMMASVAVLLGGILMRYFGWFWVDSLLTILIAIYLVVVGYDLLNKSFKVLMLFTPDDVDLNALRASISQHPDIGNVHHIHIWQLNEYEVHLEAHIDFNRDITLSEFDSILEEIEHILHVDYGVNHVNIQPEYHKDDNKEIIVQD